MERMDLELEGLNRPSSSGRGGVLAVEGLLNSEVREEIVMEKKRMGVFGRGKVRRGAGNRSVEKVQDSPGNG